MNKIIMLFRLIPPNGKPHQKQEVYSIFGISPTITATCYKDPPRVQLEDDIV